MAVSWYAVKCWKMVPPPDSTSGVPYSVGTKPTHSWTWEVWDVFDDEGVLVKQVPQMLRRKYRNWAIAYDREYDGVNEATFPVAALLRIEHPDGSDPPLEAGDYNVLLDTQNKWDALVTQYPTLAYRFLDQPYYPATG
jgi:hypothetical protein